MVTDVLQKLAEDKVALQRRRDILKRTVQDLGSQYEALKTQLNENETYVQVMIDATLSALPHIVFVDIHLKFTVNLPRRQIIGPMVHVVNVFVIGLADIYHRVFYWKPNHYPVSTKVHHVIKVCV